MTMSDRIAVMRNGVILQIGAPMEIYDQPNCRFVADFIGESNVLSGTVRHVNGTSLSVETPDGMVLTHGDGFREGEDIYISIRPEYLSVQEKPHEGFTLRARVKDFIYMGTVVKTSLDLPNGQELKLSRFEADSSLREGDERFVWWEPEKSIPIHREEGER